MIFIHDRGKSKALGYCTDGYVPLVQQTLLEPGVRPMHDASGVDLASLRRSAVRDEAFCFLTDVLLSQLYSLISSGSL